MNILDRTFGLEIEYANVDKSKVILPAGFQWDEVETVHNTDATIGTYNSRYGGELNTRPMKLCHEDLTDLKKLIDSCRNSGAIGRRDLAIQVHIFIGDLDIESVKRIFFLCYYTSNILKNICNEPSYSDEQRYRPSPTLQFYRRIRETDDFVKLRQALENSSNKGYYRHFVNISSYFVRNTVEFRLFNSTTDFDEIVRCIMFSYRFVNYSISHTEEDFKQLISEKLFRKALKFNDNLPILPKQLIYFNNVKEQDKGKLAHKAVDVSSGFVSMINQNSTKEIISVNPRLFSLECKLFKYKKIVIYNYNELNHIVWRLASNDFKIHYNGNAAFLESYNDDTPTTQVAMLLLFHRIKNYFADNVYAKSMLSAYKSKIVETLNNAKVVSSKIIDMLNMSEYNYGTLNDAVNRGGYIFFNFDDYAKYRSTVSSLRKNSDYDDEVKRLKTEYYEIEDKLKEHSVLSLISTNPNLQINKIAQIGDKILYSTKKSDSKAHIDLPMKETFSINEPPDDLDISNAKELKICSVKPSLFKIAQERYVKKVENFSSVRFSYLVFYDKYLLGGFGLNNSKNSDYDLWLLSDFCTNNNIPRLSKLILLCIKSQPAFRSISRKNLCLVSKIYTKVYTHNPVSMKYRGLFRKVEQTPNSLIYDTELGTSGSIQDVINKYQIYKQKNK